MEDLLHAPHPLETILLSRRFRLENSASIDTFLAMRASLASARRWR